MKLTRSHRSPSRVVGQAPVETRISAFRSRRNYSATVSALLVARPWAGWGPTHFSDFMVGPTPGRRTAPSRKYRDAAAVLSSQTGASFSPTVARQLTLKTAENRPTGSLPTRTARTRVSWFFFLAGTEERAFHPTAGKFSSHRNDWAIASSSNSERMGPGFAHSGSSARMSVALRGLRMRSISHINLEIPSSPTSGLLPMKLGLFRHPGKSNSPYKWAAPLLRCPTPSRDGKQILCSAVRKLRGELVRYDTKSKQFEPFLSGISATEPNIFQRREMGRICVLSGPYAVAQPQRWNGTDAANLPSDKCGVSSHFT